MLAELTSADQTMRGSAVISFEVAEHPLESDPERVRSATAEIVARHPAATPEDVLLWAEARGFTA
jgi:hypothetical protein